MRDKTTNHSAFHTPHFALETALAAFNAIAAAISQSPNLDEVISTALNVVLEATGFEAGGIALWNEKEQRLERAATRGVEPQLMDAFLGPPRAGGHREHLLRTGQPVFHDDTAHDPTVNPEIARLGFTLSAMVPLPHAEKVLGILAVATRAPRRWTEEDKTLLTAVGQQLAIAVANAQLYEELQRSEEKYRSLVNMTNDLIFTVDVEGNILFANPAAKAFTGYESEETIGHHFSEYVHPEDVPILLAGTQQVLSGEPLESIRGVGQPIEYRMRRRSGQIVWVQTRSWLLRDAQGKIVGFSGITHDITERKQAEEALRISEERFALAVHGANDGIWDWDIRTNALYWSPRMKELLGYAENELDVDFHTFESFLHPDDLEPTKAAIEAHLRERVPFNVEQRLRTKSGEYRWFNARGQALWDENGRPIRMVGSTTDITDRRQAEEALRRRDAILSGVAFAAEQLLSDVSFGESVNAVLARLGQAADISRVYVFENHVDEHGTLLTSQRYEWVAAGITPQIDNPELQNFPWIESGFGRWVEALSKNEVLYGLVRDFPESERSILEPQNIISIAIVPIFVGGEWWGFIGFDDCLTERHWSSAEIEALRAAAGALGAAIQRKQAGEKLRAREAELAAVFESTPLFLALLDEERRVTKINRAGADFSGRPADEVLGLLPGEALNCLHVLDDPRGCGYGPYCEQCAVRKTVLDTLYTGRSHHQVEADRPVRRNDRLETLRLLVSTARVSTPAGPRVLVSIEDITVRHRTLETLRAIYDLGQKLVLSLQAEEIAQLVTDAAHAILHFPTCDLWLVDTDKRMLKRIAQSSAEPLRGLPSLPLDGERGIIAAVARKGQTIYLPNVHQDPRYVRGADYPSRCELCVPLRVRERTIGALNVESEQPDAFGPAERELLEALANVAAVAIENARLFEETKRRAAETTALLETSLALNSLDMDSTLRTIGQRAKALFAADGCRIFLLEPDGETLRCVLALHQRAEAVLAMRPRLGQGVTGDIAQRGEAEIVNDMLADPRSIQVPGTPVEQEAMMIAPLKERERVIGVMSVSRQGNERPFQPADLELLKALASMASSAISNACLFEQTQRQAVEMASLHAISLRLATSGELKESLQAIVEQAATLVRAEGSGLYLYDQATDELKLAVVHGIVLEEDLGTRLKPGEGLSGKVMQERRPMVVNDYHAWEERSPKFEGRLYKAVVATPLLWRDQLVGVLVIADDKEQRTFTDDDVRLLNLLAQQAAATIANARLFGETRQLKEFNESIVLSIAEGILVENADGICTFANPAGAEMLGYAPAELLGRHWTSIVPPDQQPVVEAANERRKRGEFDRYEVELVRKDGRRLSVLVSGSPRFEDGRFAGTIAVFTDITERKRRERELEAQALLTRALSETLELQPLLERLLQAARHAVPAAEKGSLALLTDEEHLQVKALSGYQDPRVLGFTYPVTWGYAGRAARERRPLLIPDGQTDPALQTNDRTVGIGEVDALRSAIAVPLQAAGAMIGVLSLESSQPNAFTKADLQTLASMASTAGLLVQNARLYEKTRRQARQQEALNAIIMAATATTDLPDLLEIALEHTLAGLGLEIGAIWVRERPDGPIVARAVKGLPDPTGVAMEGEIAEASHVAGLGHSALLAVDDWRQMTGPYATLAPIMARHNVAALVTVPIGKPGQELGKLSVAASQPRAWTTEEVALVEAVGRQLAGAIERLQLLRQVQHQAAQMQEVLDNVPAGVLLLDAEYRILMANPLAQEYLAYLKGVSLGEVLEHLGGRPIAEFLQLSPTGTTHELAVKGPPERIFTVLAEAVPLGSTATAAGWVLVLRDVTQERAARQRIETRDRLAAIGQLAAGIAHDFNNILSAIILHTFMVRRESTLSAKALERIDLIHNQAEQATKLIGQILDFSRRAMLEPRPLELVPFLKEFVKMLERTLPEHIRVRFQYPQGQFLVTADPTRLQQALMNLAVNARDAMPAGGELTFVLDWLRVTPEDAPLPEMAPGTWIAIQVSDTGCGIAPDIMPHIFEPFFTTKEPTQGTGLGLAQVYGIVKQHGGEIDVRSAVGQGTTFTLYFPAAATAQPVTALQAAPEPEPGTGQTILIVEDNPNTRLALADTLELLKYKVLQAGNGREALAILAAHPEIALVLGDLIMPDMGGRDLLQSMRSQGYTTPVIIMTGHSLDERLEELQPYGLVGWLTKPFDLEKLTGMIKEVLKG